MTFSFGIAFYLAPLTGIIGLIFAYLQYKDVLSLDRGTEKMREVQDAIMEGSKAFIRRQTKTITMIGAVITVIIYIAIDLQRDLNKGIPMASLAFLLGATSSIIAGFIAMIMAAETNARTTQAATTSRSDALQTSYKGGLVLGLSVVSFSILGISILFFIYSLGASSPRPSDIIAFGFGASFAALFAQLGGGIFTKSADVGADLVGKIEAGIPEDDPRNPGVIADNTGDAVGDCAGRGADLFESISGETIGAMIVGLIFYTALKGPMGESFAIGFIIFPLVARGISMLATLGTLPLIKLDDEKDMKVEEDEDGHEVISFEGNPMKPMSNAFYLVSAISFVVFTFLIMWLLADWDFGTFWPLVAAAGVGIVLAILTLWVTDYYTGDHKPVLSIVESSTTGAATNIITGLSVGMMSTWLPMLSLIGAIVISYILGISIPVNGADNEIVAAVTTFAGGVKYLPGATALAKSKAIWGIFATTIATMSMLSVTPMILTMDGFGPIADQSGGIAEMSDAGEDTRAKIDSLDMVGNTTKALAKGYGMTSAGLAALLLFQAYLEDLHKAGADAGATHIAFAVDLINPGVLAGLFIGALLPFVFTAFSMKSVGRAAGQMIDEIRRQFAANGEAIMNYEMKPDYAACVTVATDAALKEMVIPSLLVVITPILVAFIFGPLPLASFLIGATGSGILLGLTMNNAGGAWDNAKKTIETGVHGGKGSPAHEAAVIGDTVGDPTKDTSGPSIHVLIKLVNTIAITMVPLLVVVKPLIAL